MPSTRRRLKGQSRSGIGSKSSSSSEKSKNKNINDDDKLRQTSDLGSGPARGRPRGCRRSPIKERRSASSSSSSSSSSSVVERSSPEVLILHEDPLGDLRPANTPCESTTESNQSFRSSSRSSKSFEPKKIIISDQIRVELFRLSKTDIKTAAIDCRKVADRLDLKSEKLLNHLVQSGHRSGRIKSCKPPSPDLLVISSSSDSDTDTDTNLSTMSGRSLRARPTKPKNFGEDFDESDESQNQNPRKRLKRSTTPSTTTNSTSEPPPPPPPPLPHRQQSSSARSLQSREKQTNGNSNKNGTSTSKSSSGRSSQDNTVSELSDEDEELLPAPRRRSRKTRNDSGDSDDDEEVVVKQYDSDDEEETDDEVEVLPTSRRRGPPSSPKSSKTSSKSSERPQRSKSKKNKSAAKSSSADEDDDDSANRVTDEESPQRPKKKATPKKNKKKKKERRRRGKNQKSETDEDDDEDQEEEEDEEDSDAVVSDEEKPTPSKRSRSQKAKQKSKTKKRNSDNSDDHDQDDDDVEEVKDSGEDEDKKGAKGRKYIKKIISDKKLNKEAQEAQEAERARRERIARRQETYNKLNTSFSERKSSPKDPQKKAPEGPLVLEFDEKSGKPIVQVDAELSASLKPHQREGLKFLYENMIESVKDVLEDKEGTGCILAHSMGLGKTLQVIAFIHTALTHRKLSKKLRTVVVICPVNTIKNWVNEFYIWIDEAGLRYRLNVFDISLDRDNRNRIETLRAWQERGGILIAGYNLYSSLLGFSRAASRPSKKQLEIFTQLLANPGPDLVIVDEGHMLKNESTQINQAMQMFRSRRRAILTGTPLQNNLVEYFVMVSFVKPNFLGSKREFTNRFVNPITNGQHEDSLPYDVKLMQKRTHILHKMLDSCVHRRDYRTLAPYLPTKYEYVITVKLTPLQTLLYRKYLEARTVQNGATILEDFSVLRLIWNHPCLLYDQEERREETAVKKEIDREMKDFIESDDTDDEDEEAEMSLAETTSEEEEESSRSKRPKKKKSNKKSKKHKNKKSSKSSDSNRRDEKKSQNGSNHPVGDQNGNAANHLKSQSQRVTEVIDLSGSDTDEKSQSSSDGDHHDDDDDRDSISTPSASDADVDNGGVKLKTNDKTYATYGGRFTRLTRGAAAAYKKAGIDVHEKRPPKKKKNVVDQEDHEDDQDNDDEGPVHLEPDVKPAYVHWFSKHIKREEDSIELSGKMTILFEILGECERVGDKVILFSTSLSTLDLIERMLANKMRDSLERRRREKADGILMTDNGDVTHMWLAGLDYFRIDGSVDAEQRKTMIDKFNDHDNLRSRVFLLSTKAGGIGVNLIGANRCVIFDASWNPSVDLQALFRIYRFGQRKPTYVYRLIAAATMEEKIYDRQVLKLGLAGRVVDEQHAARLFKRNDIAELYNFEPDKATDRGTPIVPKDRLLAELVHKYDKKLIQTVHEHDSLLETEADADLTEEERQTAWQEWETNKDADLRYAEQVRQAEYLQNILGQHQAQQQYQQQYQQHQQQSHPQSLLSSSNSHVYSGPLSSAAVAAAGGGGGGIASFTSQLGYTDPMSLQMDPERPGLGLCALWTTQGMLSWLRVQAPLTSPVEAARALHHIVTKQMQRIDHGINALNAFQSPAHLGVTLRNINMLNNDLARLRQILFDINASRVTLEAEAIRLQQLSRLREERTRLELHLNSVN